MKIIQLVDGLTKGDGVGNVVFAMDGLIKKLGYDTEICNQRLSYTAIHSDLFQEENIAIYHLSLNVDPMVKFLKCRKILYFHNITDPELLIGNGLDEFRLKCSAGLYDTQRTALYFEAAIAASEYSKKILINAGWDSSKITVIPNIVRIEKYGSEPDGQILKKYGDGRHNILFAGRIFPNKRQENVIAAFAAYKEKFDSAARLFLIGSITNMPYYQYLSRYIEQLGIKSDVVLTGHISMKEYIAYYHIADLFLCMSAHEGFCIPLVEAMYFSVPIIAVNSTAVPDTLGGSGILIDEEMLPEEVACKMYQIMTDDGYRQKIIDGQNRRLEALMPEELERRYVHFINRYVIRERIGKGTNEKKEAFPIELELYLPERLLQNQEYPTIIYGFGTAGRRLYAELKEGKKIGIQCICDVAFSKDCLCGECELLKPEDAIEKYRNANYIVSVQDKVQSTEIALLLYEKGIRKQNIYIYDEMNGRVG